MHYYKRHLGDYARDTGHLSLLEHGAYTVLLDWSYAAEKPLPAAMEAIFRLCRASSAAEKRAVEFVVAEFFPMQDGQRRNKRVAKEVAAFANVSEVKSAAANKRWHSTSNAPADAPALQEQSACNANREPRTENQIVHTQRPGLEEVLAFGREQGLPDDRLIAWHERKSNSVKHGWATVLDWRTDLLTAARSARWGQKKNAADVVESPGGPRPAWQQVQESKRLDVLKRQLREAQEERDALDQCGAEVPAELKKRCRELAAELGGCAVET